MTEFTPWQYRATVAGFVDGDTLDIVFDLGFDIQVERRVRLVRVDTAEIHFISHDSEEYQHGIEHAEFVEEWVESHAADGGEWPFVAKTEKDKRGKYGRYLVDLRPADGDESGPWLTVALLEAFPDTVDYYD